MIFLSWLLPLSLASASPGEKLLLGVGEHRRIVVPAGVGIVISEPRVADVQMVAKGVAQVNATSTGDAQIEVWTANAQRIRYRLEVRGHAKSPAPSEPPPAPPPEDEEWSTARFGGRRIPDASCVLPFATPEADRLFEEAVGLLQHDDAEAAVAKLVEVTRIEPLAATPHLFLGAAWAKLKDADRGSQALETFVLSCEADPRAPAATEVLRRFLKKRADKL